ncbi:MAG: hypothetical protein FWH14_05235 [Oscillospiraceae bacterium]|nr:hypothetical protein [Oscillospiraceae bacterium]
MNQENNSQDQASVRSGGGKITKYHWQGFAGMLIVLTAVFLVTVFLLEVNLFGILDNNAKDEGVALNAVPGTVVFGENFAGETFEIIGIPGEQMDQIKPEHISLSGYFYFSTVESVEVAEDKDLITVTVSPPSADIDEEHESYSYGIGMISVTLPESETQHTALVSIAHLENADDDDDNTDGDAIDKEENFE